MSASGLTQPSCPLCGGKSRLLSAPGADLSFLQFRCQECNRLWSYCNHVADPRGEVCPRASINAAGTEGE